MISILLCIIYFSVTLAATRKQLWAGVACVLFTGYTNAIVRANISGIASQFMFDASVTALYIGAFSIALSSQRKKETNVLRSWVIAIVGWVLLLFIIPQQTYLVQLIGIRSTIFYMLAVFVGLRLTSSDLYKIVIVIAGLNILAFAVGMLEFIFGVERFMPYGPTTRLIYQSNDVGAGRALRIPSMFAHAHVYGGTMVVSSTLLIGALFFKPLSRHSKTLVALGLLSGVFGIFLCAARTPAAAVMISFVYLLTIVRLGPSVMAGFSALVGVAAFAIGTDVRLQRFTALFDSKGTIERIGGSANAGFLDVLAANPMGNGLGGSGVGIPYFLEGNFIPPEMGMENEFARLVTDTGWLGLALYVGFFSWTIFQNRSLANDEWKVARKMVWFCASFGFATCFLGLGMLIALPTAFMTFLLLGWALSPDTEKQSSAGNKTFLHDRPGPISAHLALAGDIDASKSKRTHSN